MRIESSVTSISWIPMKAVEGIWQLPFTRGLAHYDPPPPEMLTDLEALRAADRFRFANELRAWIEVEDGRIVGYGHLGRGHIGSTTLRLGQQAISFAAVPFPDLRPEPEVAADRVRFVQTSGGRTGVPAPRLVPGRPFVKMAAPRAWTTLALTIHTDGTSSHELVGASPFPRHWIYDHAGRLVAKSGLIDYTAWWRRTFGERTPWGGEDAPALVKEVESAVEHDLSVAIIDARPRWRRLRPGELLVTQGDQGAEAFLLFDGVIAVEIDGERVAEVGPGAVLGEMALVGGGTRTASLRAVTPCRVAVVPGGRLDREALARVARARRREGGG
jgi:Cyclic nucleotide-binding domain